MFLLPVDLRFTWSAAYRILILCRMSLPKQKLACNPSNEREIDRTQDMHTVRRTTTSEHSSAHWLLWFGHTGVYCCYLTSRGYLKRNECIGE